MVLVWLIAFVSLFVLPLETKDPIGDIPKINKDKTSNNVSAIINDVVEKNKEPLKYIDKIIFDVPFTSQAPLGKWIDPRQEHGCEEASALMAMAWVRGISKLSPQESEKEIIAISEYELLKYGTYLDTSAEDTVSWIFNDYFKNENVKIKYNISIEDIKKELFGGNLVITPVNGRRLKNQFYTPPGPIEHMIVVIGYDGESKEFITNDPGTRRGSLFRYKEDILSSALMNYSTSTSDYLQKNKTAMIVVGRETD